MKTETVQKLLDINHQFYQTFASEFDATRMRIQPGMAHVIVSIPKGARILDLGCGNGELARELVRRGFEGEYVGVDFSEELIQIARETCQVYENLAALAILHRDLTTLDWDEGLDGPFDVVLAFAVLHHLPPSFYLGIVQKVRQLLTNESMDKQTNQPTNQQSRSPLFSPAPFPRFILSNWQFLNSPRWQARVQPWERVGLAAEDVGPDDYLLDWRRGGEGLRYVHHFSEPELASLAEEVGFEVSESFTSDGKEGNLGLYQVWKIADNQES